MYHRGQNMNFRTSEAPLGGSFYSFLLRPRFQHLNVGDLLEYVVDKLWHLTAVKTDRVDFTLVNACSPFTKFSHGSCEEPPRSVWPTGPLLILTFAVSPMQRYDEDPAYHDTIKRESHVRVHDNNSTQWSTVAGKVDFVSISVGLSDAHALGLQQPKSNELEYIYNLIGPATKSIIRHQPQYISLGNSYADVHEQLNLKAVHDKIFRMPVPVLFKSVPYHLWVFSRELWLKAPNLIPQRLITPAAALYWFMYLADEIPLTARTSQDVGLKRLGLRSGKKAGILGHMISSVLGLAQLVKTPGDRQLDSLQLLAPSVMVALLRTNHNKIQQIEESYQRELSDQAMLLVNDLSVFEQQLGNVLFPPDEVAFSLMLRDLEYVSDLAALLGLVDVDPASKIQPNREVRRGNI